MSVDHSGHRQRLKRALKENGLMSFSPHEVIEPMLYTALPRRDVNELAHVIDDELGGINGLMDAGKDALLEMGLSENAANVLLAYTGAVKAYGLTAGKCAEKIITRGDAARLAGRLRRPDGHALALLSPAREVIFTSPLPNEGEARFIAERALSYDAAEAIIIEGGSSPFPAGKAGEIREKLSLIDVNLALM